MGTNVFVEVASPGVVDEGSLVGGAERHRSRPLDADTADASFAARVRNGLGVGLRWAARALLLSPVLAVARLPLRAVSPRLGDATVAVFVGVVVAFFAMLDIWLLASIVWWAGRRRRHLAMPRLAARAHGAQGAGGSGDDGFRLRATSASSPRSRPLRTPGCCSRGRSCS